TPDADNSQAHAFSGFEREADHCHCSVRTLGLAGGECGGGPRTQNVRCNQKSRTAHCSALDETSSGNILRFFIPWHVVGLLVDDGPNCKCTFMTARLFVYVRTAPFSNSLRRRVVFVVYKISAPVDNTFRSPK